MDYKKEYNFYWSQSDRFGEKSFFNEDSLSEEIISAIGYGSLLDIGSGMGDLVCSLLKKGVNASGIDVSSVAVEHANKKAQGRFIEGSVLSLPFEENSFDNIISTDCLEHLSPEDVVKAIKEIYRVCKKNLYFVIATTQDRENHYHLTVENRTWWEQKFFEAGFRKHSSYYKVSDYEKLQFDGSQIKIVLEKIPQKVLLNYPLNVLLEERDLHMDMTREVGERSDAHIYRYFEIAKYIRNGDTILDAACGLGYGSYTLYQNSLASKIIGIDGSAYGIDYAKNNFGIENKIVFQEGFLPNVLYKIPDQSVDFITSFETLEHVENPIELLLEFYRILTPGGRIAVSVPNDWSDETGEDPNPFHLHVYTWNKIFEQLSQNFDIESSYIQSATRCKDKNIDFKEWKNCSRKWTIVDPNIDNSNIEGEWWILVGMKNSKNLLNNYNETLFPYNNLDNNAIAFSRDYENPWLIRSMISIGMRNNNSDILVKYAEEIIDRNLNKKSADYGASLCVLAYQLLNNNEFEKVKELILPINEYLVQDYFNPNQYRWQVSLSYFLAIYYKQIGNFDISLDYFEKCTQFDIYLYHHSLVTKMVDACYWAGLLSISIYDNLDKAKYYWKKAIKDTFDLLAKNNEYIYDLTENPLVFGIDEVEISLDTVRKCANGLYSISFGKFNNSYFSTFLSSTRLSQKDWLETQVQSLTLALNEKEKNIENIQEGKDWLETQVQSLTLALNEKEKNIENIQEGKDWLETQVQSLTLALNEKEKNIENIQEGKDWLETQVQSLTLALNEKEKNIENIQEGKDWLETQVQSLTLALNEKEKNIENIQEGKDWLETQVQSLTLALNEKEKNIENIQEGKDWLETQVQSLTLALNEKEKNIENIQEGKDWLETQVQSLTLALNEKEKNIENIQEGKDWLETQVQSLTLALNEKEKNIENIQEGKDWLETQVQSLTLALNEKEYIIQELEKKNDELENLKKTSVYKLIRKVRLI